MSQNINLTLSGHSLTQSTTTSSYDVSHSPKRKERKCISNSVIILENSDETSLKRKCSASNHATKRLKTESSFTEYIDILESPKSSKNQTKCSTPVTTNTRNKLCMQKTNRNVNNNVIYKKVIENNSNNNNVQNIQKLNNDIIDLTDEFTISEDITIDLTKGSDLSVSNNIDLYKSPQCTNLISASNSISGNSNVTILENKLKGNTAANNFAKYIMKMNSTEKSKLLDMIVQKTFNGCQVPTELEQQLKRSKLPCQEITYHKEVIHDQSKSRSSVGSNVYHPSRDPKNRTGLRMVVIDGSNVAMEHSKGRQFSVMGLKICIDFFVNRGHVVKAFVPRFRCKNEMSSDPKLLNHLERMGLVVYTPSREIQGKTYVPYDDRYIVQCAAEFGGVIVTGDKYKDLINENARWRQVIEKRLLPFTWVDDMIMFPKDPLGKNGPTLDEFLKHPPVSELVIL